MIKANTKFIYLLYKKKISVLKSMLTYYNNCIRAIKRISIGKFEYKICSYNYIAISNYQ